MSKIIGQETEQPAQELPKDKEHQQICARDHTEKSKTGQSQKHVETNAPGLLLHVAYGKHRDEKADAGNQSHHYSGQPVDIKTELHKAAHTRGEKRDAN